MNLFWKLFAILGVAITVALVGAVSISWRVGQTSVDTFNFESRETVIAQTTRALQQGGREQLTTWLRQNQKPAPGATLYIADDSGNDLLAREIPEFYRRYLASGPWRFRGPSWGAQRNFFERQIYDVISAPNGDSYGLLFVRTEITLLGFLAWPTTQLAVVALAVIMATATSLLLARYLSLPIVRLQRVTRSLAAGALDTRVGEPFNQRKDEVGTLARDFDAMAEHIQGLITDKEVLLRDVSHELRSPLARIRVALALAQRKADTSAQQDLERIEQETERLDQLVGQILTLARLRSSALDENVNVNLREVVSEVVADARFEHPGVSIQYADQAVPPVRGNAGELASAIENVLRNALLHSGPDAGVEISLQPVANGLTITIADTGTGVPEAELKHLFEPFYRADPSRDHKQSGYGLGLAIAARIVERHGGTIDARNRPGGGLAVTFRFPAGRLN